MTIKILLVEDDAAFALAIKATLKRKSRFEFELETVGWLFSALERIAEGDIDLVLLDISLPDSNGIDTLLKVRQLRSFLPVIVLTGHEDDIALESLRMGAQDYLLKGTLDGDVLCRSISFALERSRLIEQRDEFIATLTHDLKNPLIGSNRVLQLLSAGSLGDINEKQVGILTKIQHTNTNLLLMIENLLEVYRLEKDLNPIIRTHTDLIAVVSGCVEEIQPIAEEKKVSIEQELDLVERLVLLDKESVRRVMQNLLDNALKFTPAGGSIKVKLEDRNSDVLLQVSDTGPGISAEDQKVLFERFARGAHGKNYRHGTGLGLYLCKKLIEMHGGTITCHSDGGTTFNVQLPIESAA